MRYHQLGLAVAVAALAVAAAGVSAAATVVTGRSSERTAVAASSSLGRPQSVLLINGDIVSAPTGGASTVPSTITTSGSGLAESVVTLGLGGKAYQIPAAALPYLGKGLDPGLFQIS